MISQLPPGMKNPEFFNQHILYQPTLFLRLLLPVKLPYSLQTYQHLRLTFLLPFLLPLLHQTLIPLCPMNPSHQFGPLTPLHPQLLKSLPLLPSTPLVAPTGLGNFHDIYMILLPL